MVKDRVTYNDKQKFLELIRAGHNRAGAARRVNPDHTGTMYARLCSQESASYDHDFAVAYAEAVAERGKPRFMSRHSAYRQPRVLSERGRIRAVHISDDKLEEFIIAVSNGIPTKAAADAIGTSLYQLNQRAERDGQFAARYAEAKRIGYPIMQENLRAETERQAFNGDYRALRDLNMIHLPEFIVLRDRQKQQDLSRADLVELITAKMGDLPPAVLDEMIRLIETPQLEEGDVDSEATEAA